MYSRSRVFYAFWFGCTGLVLDFRPSILTLFATDPASWKNMITLFLSHGITGLVLAPIIFNKTRTPKAAGTYFRAALICFIGYYLYESSSLIIRIYSVRMHNPPIDAHTLMAFAHSWFSLGPWSAIIIWLSWSFAGGISGLLLYYRLKALQSAQGVGADAASPGSRRSA